MAGEGPPSTTSLDAAITVMDADVRRHDGKTGPRAIRRFVHCRASPDGAVPSRALGFTCRTRALSHDIKALRKPPARFRAQCTAADVRDLSSSPAITDTGRIVPGSIMIDTRLGERVTTGKCRSLAWHSGLRRVRGLCGSLRHYRFTTKLANTCAMCCRGTEHASSQFVQSSCLCASW